MSLFGEIEIGIKWGWGVYDYVHTVQKGGGGGGSELGGSVTGCTNPSNFPFLIVIYHHVILHRNVCKREKKIKKRWHQLVCES